jgi:hypothetical protein
MEGEEREAAVIERCQASRGPFTPDRVLTEKGEDDATRSYSIKKLVQLANSFEH